MVKSTVKLYAGLIILLAVIGVINGGGKFLNFLNTDGALDLLRIAFGILLLDSLYGVARGLSLQRLALMMVGFLYVGLGIWGFLAAQ